MTTPATAPATSQPTRDDPTIWRVDDALWAELQPVLRIDKPRKKPGRPRVDDRAIFAGLIWLARTGSQWADGCLVKAPLGKKGIVARRKQPARIPPTAARAASSGIC